MLLHFAPTTQDPKAYVATEAGVEYRIVARVDPPRRAGGGGTGRHWDLTVGGLSVTVASYATGVWASDDGGATYTPQPVRPRLRDVRAWAERMAAGVPQPVPERLTRAELEARRARDLAELIALTSGHGRALGARAA